VLYCSSEWEDGVGLVVGDDEGADGSEVVLPAGPAGAWEALECARAGHDAA
jgi:hypothetical protein